MSGGKDFKFNLLMVKTVENSSPIHEEGIRDSSLENRATFLRC